MNFRARARRRPVLALPAMREWGAGAVAESETMPEADALL